MNVKGSIRPVIFFCDHTKEYGFLSNWFVCRFNCDLNEFFEILNKLQISITPEIETWLLSQAFYGQIVFVSTEQAVFAFCKALVANDLTALEQAYHETSSSECQRIGRNVKLNMIKWNRVKEALCIYFNYLKFSQNANWEHWMMSNTDKMFVEASLDPVWSIGIDIDDDRRLDVANWNGNNLMGSCLQTVQEMLVEQKEEEKRIKQNIRNKILEKI
jgi:ribA/ribD-fused uncharacterized protein